MFISPTNVHWRERPTNSGQKSFKKKEPFTLEENLRWTSASSAKLFLSWAQASPSVLKEERDNDRSPAHPSSWDLSDKSGTTLCTTSWSAKSWKRVTEIWENNQPLWPRQNCVGIVCSGSLKTQLMTISTYRDTRASIRKILQYPTPTTTKFPPMQFFHCNFYFTPYFKIQTFASGEESWRSFSALEDFSMVFFFQIISKTTAAEAHSSSPSMTA